MVLSLLKLLLLLYILALVGVMILSWFPIAYGSPMSKVNEVLRRITDPLLVPLRRVIPPIGGAIDISPTILLFVLLIVRAAL